MDPGSSAKMELAMTNLTRHTRTFALALVALFTLVIGIGTASAQAAQTWLPAYDSSQKVYIDPSLTDFSLTPGFAGNIEKLAAKHSLNVVVIATARGADITNSDRKRWAPEYLHTTAWQHLERYPAFSEARSVVILFVKDGTTVSTGVRVGSAMHAVGLTRDLLNSVDGPVVPALRASMPSEPEAAFIGIVNNINSYLDERTVVQAPSSSNTPAASSEGGLSGFALVAIGLAAAVVIFLFIRAVSGGGSSSSNSRNTIGAPRPTTSRATTNSAPTQSDGSSNRGTDIATGAVIGGVLGAELARRNSQPAPPAPKKKKDSGGSDTGSSGCSSTTSSGSSGCGSAGCGGGGCGGGGCGGG